MNEVTHCGCGRSAVIPRIILFLKAPRSGLVKTRLAASVGEEKAVEIYRFLVESQLRRLPRDWPFEIRFTPADAEEEMREWIGRGPILLPQGEGDLGHRLADAVAEAFARGSDPVVCIGADCPGLDVPDFEEARTALRNGADLVFGPADDGGYYLIALGRPCPEVFKEIPWSSETTLARSLEQAGKCNRKVSLLPSKGDIDHIEDWENFCGRNAVTSKK